MDISNDYSAVLFVAYGIGEAYTHIRKARFRVFFTRSCPCEFLELFVCPASPPTRQLRYSYAISTASLITPYPPATPSIPEYAGSSDSTVKTPRKGILHQFQISPPDALFTSPTSWVCAHRAFSRYFQASRKRLQALKPRSHDFHFNNSQPLLIVTIYDREKGYENG
jgi:hypothetical protein